MDSLDPNNDPSMQNVVEETVIEEQIDDQMVVEEVVEEQMAIDDGTHLNVVEETTVNMEETTVMQENVVDMDSVEVKNENQLETEHMATGSTMFSAEQATVTETVTEQPLTIPQPTETVQEQTTPLPTEQDIKDLINIKQDTETISTEQLINTEQFTENQAVVSAADGSYVQQNVIDQALLNAQSIETNPQTSESKDMENFVNNLLSGTTEENTNMQQMEQSQLLGQDTLSNLNIINVDSSAQETPTIITDHSQMMTNVADTQTLSSLTEPLLSTGIDTSTSGLDFVTQNSHQAAAAMDNLNDLTLPSMTTNLGGSVYENSTMDANKIFSSNGMQLDENNAANNNLQNEEDEAQKVGFDLSTFSLICWIFIINLFAFVLL